MGSSSDDDDDDTSATTQEEAEQEETSEGFSEGSSEEVPSSEGEDAEGGDESEPEPHDGDGADADGGEGDEAVPQDGVAALLAELTDAEDAELACVRLAFERSTPQAVVAALEELAECRRGEGGALVESQYGVFVAAMTQLRRVQEGAQDLAAEVRAHNEAVQAAGAPLLAALRAGVAARSEADRLAAAGAALDACLAAAAQCQRCGEAVARGEFYAALRGLERLRAALPRLPCAALRAHLALQLPAAEAAVEERAFDLLAAWLHDAEAAAPEVGRRAVAREAAAAAAADARWAAQLAGVRAVCGGGGGAPAFSLAEAAEEEAPEEWDGAKDAPLAGLSLAPLATARHALACLGREPQLWARYGEGRAAALAARVCAPSRSGASFLEAHQPWLCAVAGHFAVEAAVQRCTRGGLPPGWVASAWDTAGLAVATVLAATLAELPTSGEALLLAHFCRLVAAALRRQGLWTAALEAALAEGHDRFAHASAREAASRLAALAAQPGLAQQPLVLGSLGQYDKDVVSLGLHPPGPLPEGPDFPLHAPFSPLVPHALRTLRDALSDAASFCGWAGDEGLRSLARHSDALLQAVADAALAPQLARAQAMGARGALLQACADAGALEGAAPSLDAHAATLARVAPARARQLAELAAGAGRDEAAAAPPAGALRRGVLTAHRERCDEALRAALGAATAAALAPPTEGNPESYRAGPGEGAVRCAAVLAAWLGDVHTALPPPAAAALARAALGHASDALVAPLVGERGRGVSAAALANLALDAAALRDAADAAGCDPSASRAALAEPLQLAELFDRGGEALERLAGPACAEPPAFRAALQRDFFALAPHRLAPLLARYTEPQAQGGLLGGRGGGVLFAVPAARRKTALAVADRVRALMKPK